MTLSSVETLRHRTKEEYAYEVVRTAILRCELVPGEKLTLGALSSQLGISVIPLRAALQRLQSEGLVEITPHMGAVVSGISLDDIEQVFLLLEHVELVAFQVALRKVTPAKLAELRRIVARMSGAQASGDAETWSFLNREFHRAVAGWTEMSLLVEFTERTLDRWDRLRRLYLEHFVMPRLTKATADHERMVELLGRGDGERLLKLVAAHNHAALRDYQRVVAQLHRSKKPTLASSHVTGNANVRF